MPIAAALDVVTFRLVTEGFDFPALGAKLRLWVLRKHQPCRGDAIAFEEREKYLGRVWRMPHPCGAITGGLLFISGFSRFVVF